MLIIMVGAVEAYDDAKQEFTTTGGTPLKLEHSLVSLSKWEQIYEKPFLAPGNKSTEETIGYIKAMVLDEETPSELFTQLTDKNLTEVNEYIDRKMTATWFREDPNAPRSREVITAEIIYYWLIAMQIPWETQYWHLNRLLTLVKVLNQKNQPEKKMSRRDLANRNRMLNAQRKSQYGTSG